MSHEKLDDLPAKVNGVILRRRVYFMGRWLKHGGKYPELLLRIFRVGHGMSEMKLIASIIDLVIVVVSTVGRWEVFYFALAMLCAYMLNKHPSDSGMSIGKQKKIRRRIRVIIAIAIIALVGVTIQPTVSRFFNRMDEDTLNQFLTIGRILRKRVYSIQMPQAVILDLDSTLFDAYGKQEGSAFNFHYQSNGYHPLVCYDGLTEDLIKIQLRDGTQYSCTGVVDFLQPILDEYLNDYPAIRILLRGDSGFATPSLYKQCEENGTNYVIRLKENGILRAYKIRNLNFAKLL